MKPEKEEALPPLPEPAITPLVTAWPYKPHFTAEQMHAYARAALAQRQQVPEGAQAEASLRKERDGWKDEAASLRRERDYYRERAQMMYEHQRKECWYWQGDGSDHPESLHDTLPVVILAKDLRAMLAAAPALTAAPSAQPRLTVRVQSFPESNGKRNWTALLVRVNPWGGLIGNCGGITIDRGEFWNRVAYEAERARLLIGERDTEPDVLDYGDDITTPDQWAGEVRGGRPVRERKAAPSAQADPQVPLPCGQCRKADSWGIPLSKTCVYDCKFGPLNATDK